MRLGELISWLEVQDPKALVRDGFDSPHSDRGYYENLGFDPIKETTFGEMLQWAKSADGKTFIGWKGGEYRMDEHTECFIGEYGECGEEITSMHLKYWLLTAKVPAP